MEAFSVCRKAPSIEGKFLQREYTVRNGSVTIDVTTETNYNKCILLVQETKTLKRINNHTILKCIF